MVNYASIDEDTLNTESGKMLTKIKEMGEGKAEKFENDDAYYIIIKGDVKQRSKEYAEENHDTLFIISIIKPPAMQVECINFSKSMELWVDKKPP